MSTVDVQVIAAVVHDRRRVRAITLDETPSGITQMDTLADAPPIFHVISEFEGYVSSFTRNTRPQSGHVIVWKGLA